MTPRQDHARVLPPIDNRRTGSGGSSPAHSAGAALGLDATRAHPIPRVDDATVLPRRRRIPGSHALIPSEVTTAALGLRAGGGGLFHSCDDAAGDCVKPFHARNPARVGRSNRVFAS